MNSEWKKYFKICLSVFILYLCIHYLDNVQKLLNTVIGASFPLLIGCGIAYPVNILMSFYEKHYFPKSKNRILIKSRRPICMASAFLSLAAIIVLVVSIVVPQFISCVQVITAELPGAVKYLVSLIDKIDIVPENIINTISSIDWQSRIGSIIEMFTSGVGNVMDMVITLVTSVFSGIISAILSIIFAIYILFSKNKLQNQFTKIMNRYLPSKMCGKLNHFLSVLNESFHNYIVGQCTEAVILGLLCTLGMWLLRLPYATMIGALVAVTALIPIAGAYIGAFVGAFMIVTVSPVQALVFLIFIIILQQLEGNLIYPKVVGSSIGLPGIWVLAAVTIGGGIMGIAGMLFGVPVAACIYRLLREDVNRTT